MRNQVLSWDGMLEGVGVLLGCGGAEEGVR